MWLKHKTWRGQVCNAWDGPILDLETGQIADDEEVDIVKTTYKTQFEEFKMTVDIGSLENFNADADIF